MISTDALQVGILSPSLSLLTIVNEGLSLTIVNKRSSLTIANEGSSLAALAIVKKKQKVFKKQQVLKNNKF